MAHIPRPPALVYVRNLDERIPIHKVSSALSTIFSEYGNILDVVVKQSLKRKGQAFVVFEDVDSATRALDDIQGFEIFGKPMILEYAKTKSDAWVKENGNDRDFELHRRSRLAEKERKQALEAQSLPPTVVAPQKPGAAPSTGPLKRGAGLKSTTGSAAVIPDEYLPPNKILFLQNIPDDYHDVEALSALFGRFEGFREVRLVPGRKGIAFVEYETETGSISAKERMAGIALGETGQVVKVTFQRQ